MTELNVENDTIIDEYYLNKAVKTEAGVFVLIIKYFNIQYPVIQSSGARNRHQNDFGLVF